LGKTITFDVMRRKSINKILSLLMAFLVLVSSTGFSIDIHLCQGKIKNFSLLGEAKSCHSQVEKSICKHKKSSCCSSLSNQNKLGTCKQDCCSNKTINVESNDNAKKIQTAEISPVQIKFITTFVQVFLLDKIDLKKANIPHLKYIPPLLSKDIPVLIQSFLL